MLDPMTRGTRDEAPVHGHLVLSRLGSAVVEVEDQATDVDPTTVSVRIGDTRTAVLLQGDLTTVLRLIVEAERQLSRLHHDRRDVIRR